MRYDLLVQSADPKATPYDDTPFNALLKARGGLATTPDGRTVWRLRSGEVEVKPLREGGQLIATELRVPLGESLDLIRETVLEACILADEAKVKLFDPQLARPLTRSDDTAVADQYQKTAKYAGSMMGVPEAVGAAYEPAKPGFTPTTKMVVVVIGAFILLYFIVNSMAGALGGGE